MNNKASQIVEHLKKNGGTIQAAARALDIKLTSKLRQELIELDSNLERFRYAFKRYGDWLTLPTDKASSRDSQKVDSLCLSCNEISQVSIIGLVSGRSKGCFHCQTKHRNNHPVRCSESGKTYSSIRAFAKSIGRSDQYQSLRHKLNATGSVVVEGSEYTLVSPDLYT